MRRQVIFFAFFLVSTGGCGRTAAAKPKESKDEAASRTEQKALRVYVAGDLAGAVKLLEGGLRACEKGCSAKVRAHLHISLGTVHGIGEGDYKGAKHEFMLALTFDPEAKLRTLSTPELTTAFEEAKQALASTKPPDQSDKPPDKPPPDKPPPDKQPSVTDLFHNDDSDKDRDKPPPKPKDTEKTGPEPRYNWLSLRLMTDFAFLTDKNICGPNQPAHYYCTDESGGRYTGSPQPNDKTVSNGFAFSTLRIVLGYERLLFPNVTAGALIGYGITFSSPEGRSGPSPFLFEARATYTFGAAPYLDGGDTINPFLYLAIGVTDVDSHVIIRVNEIPCNLHAGVACKRDLDAYRLVSGFYTTLGAGVRYRIEGRHGLRAGLRGTLLFDDGARFIATPEITYELGI